FLGDTGSYFFGAVCASVVIASGTVFTPALVPLIPYLYDVAFTLVRRLLTGRSLTTSHREHLYQRLQAGLRAPHLAVAFGYALLAGLVSVGWVFLPTIVWGAGTVIVLAAYSITVAHVPR